MKIDRLGYSANCITEDGNVLDAVKILKDILRAYDACSKSDMIFEDEVCTILKVYNLIDKGEG